MTMKKQFKFPENLLYHSTYVWIEDRGRDIFRVGLTDFGQYVLDDMVSISLPETGIYVEEGEEIVSIDSIEDSLVIKAPISGTIDEINDILRQSPELLNESPFEEGWILKIELGSNEEVDHLMDSNEVLDHYQEQIEDEEFDDEEFEDTDEFGEEKLNYDDDFSNY